MKKQTYLTRMKQIHEKSGSSQGQSHNTFCQRRDRKNQEAKGGKGKDAAPPVEDRKTLWERKGRKKQISNTAKDGGAVEALPVNSDQGLFFKDLEAKGVDRRGGGGRENTGGTQGKQSGISGGKGS